MNGAASAGEDKQPIRVNRRKANADGLADLAVGNFIEMRDKTAPRTFRAKKKTRSPAQRPAAGYLPAALHDGHVHTHPLRGSRLPRPPSRSHRVRQPHFVLDNVGRRAVDPAVSFHWSVDARAAVCHWHRPMTGPFSF